MKRIFLITLAAVLLFAGGVAADKTITRFTVVLTDVTNLCVSRNVSSATGWRYVADSAVRSSDGSAYHAVVSGDLSSGQKTQIETFLTNNVLTAVNTQEGL